MINAPASDLPLPVLRLLTFVNKDALALKSVSLAGPGFTLSADIGDFDLSVTELHFEGAT